MQRKIAITGGIGSGKSTLSRFLGEMGYCVWDADIATREVLFWPEVATGIKSAFGETVFLSEGVLDRARMRQIVFGNPQARKTLEGILHPAIFQLFQNKIEMLEKLAPSAWIFYEASLIFELGRENFFDACILVTAHSEKRLSRVSEHRNIPESEIKCVIANQMADEEKLQKASFVIENNGSLDDLQTQAQKLLAFLYKKFASHPF